MLLRAQIRAAGLSWVGIRVTLKSGQGQCCDHPADRGQSRSGDGVCFKLMRIQSAFEQAGIRFLDKDWKVGSAFA